MYGLKGRKFASRKEKNPKERNINDTEGANKRNRCSKFLGGRNPSTKRRQSKKGKSWSSTKRGGGKSDLHRRS